MAQTALARSDYRSMEAGANEGGYLPVSDLRQQYLDYHQVKGDEIKEKKQARHYYHGDQWTSKEIATLKKRKQPVVTYNRIGRKIDGVVGLVERLKQDPKAYPRTPQHEDGAEIATAVIRYSLDANEWNAKAPEVARDGAIEGIAGVELEIVNRKEGDQDVSFIIVDPDTFFYDPRSFREDFSDARYMGVAKWIDLNLAKEMFPDKAEELSGLMDGGPSLGIDVDREFKWINTNQKRLWLVEHWYMHEGGWCWCVYTGDTVLLEGKSPFVDELDQSQCKYIMYSAAVDHDGDRYGFVRNLKSPQDEINHRRSKALHLLNTRRVIIRKGSASQVENIRREAARPDGVIEWEIEKPEFDDAKALADMQGQLEFLQETKAEIENFGPNPALIGQGIENKSGRAIALLQQAGIAELGPYILAYKGWKIRVYRALWFAIRRYWTQERWVRVTDDENVPQLLQVNGLQVDPVAGPQFVNALGQIDVDIIIDEGQDTINMMADAFDSLSMLAQRGAQIPPGLLIEVAPLDSSIKKKYLQQLEAMAQPDPAQQEAQRIAMEGEQAKTAETKSKTLKNTTDALKNARDAMLPDMTQVMGSQRQQAQPPY